jgi:hypothetical protein
LESRSGRRSSSFKHPTSENPVRAKFAEFFF